MNDACKFCFGEHGQHGTIAGKMCPAASACISEQEWIQSVLNTMAAHWDAIQEVNELERMWRLEA